MAERYSKAGPIAGRLIRQTITFLRDQGVSLPLRGPVILAFSGGADSRALALLLFKYGRKIVDGSLILAHADHGWRSDSVREQMELETWAQSLGLAFEKTRFEGTAVSGESWESAAREKRYRWLESVREKYGSHWILTAHQQGDLAESVLWAIATGQASRRGGGIRVHDGNLLRPFLAHRKSDLQAFLKEEAQTWFEDPSNQDPRFLRTRVRNVVFPVLEEVFPRVQEHLAELALIAQKTREEDAAAPLNVLVRDRGIRLRASQWAEISASAESGGVDLPHGWRIRKQAPCQVDGENPLREERWILERGPTTAQRLPDA